MSKKANDELMAYLIILGVDFGDLDQCVKELHAALEGFGKYDEVNSLLLAHEAYRIGKLSPGEGLTLRRHGKWNGYSADAFTVLKNENGRIIAQQDLVSVKTGDSWNWSADAYDRNPEGQILELTLRRSKLYRDVDLPAFRWIEKGRSFHHLCYVLCGRHAGKELD